jgi:hypothetical protein
MEAELDQFNAIPLSNDNITEPTNIRNNVACTTGELCNIHVGRYLQGHRG